MVEKVTTLHELCLQRIARLLKSSYWNPETPLNHNPFALLPSAVIDTLIRYVTRISPEFEPLLSSDLRLLLTSGRVTEFILERHKNTYTDDIEVNDCHLQKILMDLLPSCRNLSTVKIRPDEYIRGNSPTVTPALNCLLSEAQNIKHVDSCVEFNLRVLCNSFQLEKLVLYFQLPLTCHIYDFLEVDGQFKPRASLKCIHIYEDQPMSYLDIVIILKYCTELIYINRDISKSLEYLHADELHNGCLTHKYKIQKCILGRFDDIITEPDLLFSTDGVRIAALTCSDLHDLRIAVNDDNLISVLSDFHNLTVLNIEWQLFSYGDFTASLQSVLEKPKIGHKLKSLDLYGFTNIDFPSIGACCPNLEVLKIDYNGECTPEYSPTSFRKLQILSLWSVGSNCKRDTLVGSISNATNLKELVIRDARELTDDVLENILKKNALLALKELYLYNPGLSLQGWRNLASNLTALECIDVYEPNFSFQECLNVIRETNPRISVYWSVD